MTTENVKDYGAIGDNSTDNTRAFSVCLDAIIKAGGGRMHIPAGVYIGRIVIPGTKAWITVEITGESEPTPVFGTIGSFPFPQNGTIIKCPDVSGSNSQYERHPAKIPAKAGTTSTVSPDLEAFVVPPSGGCARHETCRQSGAAVISAAQSPETLYMGFSGVYVVIRNLDVRTYDNPGISGIDLQHAVQCRVENVSVNTDIYNVQASEPTHGTSGIITPANNNGALTILRNVVVTGYHTGILVNEHTDGDNLNLASNFNALQFAFGHHASRFGRVGSQRCTHNIAVTGKHAFCIEQLDVEIAGPRQTDKNNAWQATRFNINDPENLGIGDINYWVVEGNIGAVEKFTRNGGNGIRARRIGVDHPGGRRMYD